MKRAAVYFSLQCRRAFRLLPRMMAVTLLLAGLAALACLTLRTREESDTSKQKVRIGVVGNLEKGGLKEGISILESLDSSRFSLTLQPMDETEAVSELRRGGIDAYIIVPEGFVSAMMNGEHRPITFVSAGGDAGVGGILTREIAESVSTLVLETENAVYGAQNYVEDHISGLDPYESGDRITLRYMFKILDRDLLYDLETIGAADSLSLAGYYLCGIAVLFVMLWAISCSPLFTRRSRELSGLLRVQGLSPAVQVAAEYASFCLLMLCAIITIAAVCLILLPRLHIAIPELAAGGLSGLAGPVLRALPAALMLCAMSFFLFELAEGAVSGILLLFFNAAAQGYLAGCFYPSSFFPEELRTLGAVLPAGAAMDHLRACLLGGAAGGWAVWGYLLLFLILSAIVRTYRPTEGREAAQ
ncbi:MAG: ABC transporter permease [Oscillospiraceae bacterium]|nr:ABC transporter permease [Oscillospiraceae bacterium]